MEKDNWKTRTLIIGGIVGGVTGLISAALIIRRSEKSENALAVTPQEGIRIGMLVAGFLREIANIG
ncbi:MAG: hypothetical protein JXA19_03810 [Anaerolineales bacterium]|nr:hypothetical protein [Anaerolineales bacterium]